jgi:hypothetical protein
MKIQQIKNKKVSSKSSHLDFVIYLMQMEHSLSSSATPFAYIDSYNTELDDLVSVLILINNHFLLLNKHIIPPIRYIILLHKIRRNSLHTHIVLWYYKWARRSEIRKKIVRQRIRPLPSDYSMCCSLYIELMEGRLFGVCAYTCIHIHIGYQVGARRVGYNSPTRQHQTTKQRRRCWSLTSWWTDGSKRVQPESVWRRIIVFSPNSI